MTTLIHNQDELTAFEQSVTDSYLAVRPKPVLDRVIRDLEKQHKGYFDSDVGPGGNAWQENAPSTIAAKGHGEILEDTLAMMRAVTESSAEGAIREVFDEGLEAGLVFGIDDSDIPYWRFHDLPNVRLPWRPFIGITEPVVDAIAERLLKNQIKGMKDVE